MCLVYLLYIYRFHVGYQQQDVENFGDGADPAAFEVSDSDSDIASSSSNLTSDYEYEQEISVKEVEKRVVSVCQQIVELVTDNKMLQSGASSHNFRSVHRTHV